MCAAVHEWEGALLVGRGRDVEDPWRGGRATPVVRLLQSAQGWGQPYNAEDQNAVEVWHQYLPRLRSPAQAWSTPTLPSSRMTTRLGFTRSGSAWTRWRVVGLRDAGTLRRSFAGEQWGQVAQASSGDEVASGDASGERRGSRSRSGQRRRLNPS
jgi:hypothetical protein